MYPIYLLPLLLLSFVPVTGSSQKQRYPVDSAYLKTIEFRNIGPFRGGRASGVCGDYKNKQVFYMASTGGGIWRTKDGGNNWKNISDGYFGGSIGAIEVSPSDPLILYAGTGESTLRGNVSSGEGLYKSIDGGKSWKFIGLKETRHISKIVVHPRNPEIVYVAAIGNLFAANPERGIFKSVDGGKRWEQILFISSEAGASDLCMDPSNPEVLYAGTWNVKRTPYSFESGGAGSGLWKSVDGGENWENISRNKGLPKDTLGICCITICPSNSDRLYAMVESKQAGGLYTSRDAGITWSKMNDESKIRQRAWYFSRLMTDPKNEEVVWVCNVELHKSQDGGKTFQEINTPHGDHHNLWIDPEDGQRVIVADDGGAQISFDGGQHWSTYYNQPTAQFYRVTTDNHVPYRILGCQQDNSSVRIVSRSTGSSIGTQDWSSSAGFESGHIVADPTDDDIVYGGNYGGYLSRLNHRTGENRTVSVYPVSPIGEGADTLKYRFQWNFPIFFSPHNPRRLYAAGNHLFVTENEGQRWKQISPDLTTNDKSKQRPSGGIITKDNTGVEYYCTIFAAAESPVQKDLLWCGSDDGLIHCSEDGGSSWDLVNPTNMPEWMMINCIEPSPFDASTCYVVGTRYKLGDETPYIYKTSNRGKSWELITDGIPDAHFARCLRADPGHQGTLYCGTERGLYISLDDGMSWKPFQLNLPIVPITDLTIKNDDLIVATQGRSFWVLDQLSQLHQAMALKNADSWNLFLPGVSYRIGGSRNPKATQEGMNPHPGTVFRFWLPDWNDSSRAELRILDAEGKLLRSYQSGSTDKEDQLNLERGMNVFSWNHLVKGCERIDGMVLWNGTIGQYRVPPGEYRVVFKCNKDSMERRFRILRDPKYTTREEEYAEQFEFLTDIKNKFDEVQTTIKQIRQVRNQLNTLKENLKDQYPAELDTLGLSIHKKLSAIEERLYQTKAKSGQDVLNYPIRINDKLSGLFDAVNQNTAPSIQSREAWEDLKTLADEEILNFQKLMANDVREFNRLIRDKNIDYLYIKS